MDIDLSFVTSTGEDIAKIISKLEEMKKTVDEGNHFMDGKYKGISRDKYDAVSSMLIGRIEKTSGEMSEIIDLLSHIQRHNSLRIEKLAIKKELSNLYSNLTRTETDEEGNTHEVENPGVRAEINALEGKLELVNKQLENEFETIISITGG